MSKFPSFSQWKQIFKVLRKGEKTALLAFLALTVISLSFLITNFYISNTKVVPALGGKYTEGVVGQPRFINPIYGETNDVDRALIDLVFSSLVTYDKDGKITNDLAQSYQVSPDGKTYDFQLKDNIFWHDGKTLSADDVLFTIKTIQNSDYKSPLRANWIDVEVQKTSAKSVQFTLKTPYNSFLENLTVKILPKHIWETITPESFSLSAYNLQPVGSGPFVFEDLKQTNTGFIKTLNFQSNRKHHNKPAHISTLIFQFFEKKDDLIRAVNAGTVNGLTLASLENNQLQAQKEIRQGWAKQNKFFTYSFSLPRYFAVFFNNQKSSILADENLRKALSYSVDKEALIKKIKLETKNNVAEVDSPILPDFFEYQGPSNPYSFDTVLTKSLLDKTGFKENARGLRERTTTKQPAFQFKSYLRVGSKGTEVTELQNCLTRLPNENFGALLKDETVGTYGKQTENAVTEFQKKYLPDLKPTGETGVSTRAKLNELCAPPSQNSQLLKFTLTTINQPQLLQIANSLKQYWQSVGVTVDINAVSIVDLKPIIKNRNYDALLYGEALGAEPDLYPFWHSSQKVDPGLNLSSYENKDVDLLLKEAREAIDPNVKKEKYEKLQNIIINNAPALFLYNPDYIYWVAQNIQGVNTTKIIDPAKRFSNVTNWFIKTKRTWK